jgi:mannose-6-phosphate isomerase-like protein (cupin superfamily)
MIVRKLSSSEPFVTKDGSVIRSLLDLSCAPVRNQSLAEASLAPGQATTRHAHPRSEEFYFVLEGVGDMEIDGERREVGEGDAVLIPPGSAHQIRNVGQGPLRILCCCAPPYSDPDTVMR